MKIFRFFKFSCLCLTLLISCKEQGPAPSETAPAENGPGGYPTEAGLPDGMLMDKLFRNPLH